MKKVFLFLITAISLNADLYDRNKYDMDFRPEDQPRHEAQHRAYPQGGNQQNCPCDGDPQCPCRTGPNGEYYRVD